MAFITKSYTFHTPAGTVLKNANVSVYFNKTSTAARVFDAGQNLKDTAPQLATDDTGYVLMYFDDDDFQTGQTFDLVASPDARCNPTENEVHLIGVGLTTNWSEIADDNGKKPSDNADNTGTAIENSAASMLYNWNLTIPDVDEMPAGIYPVQNITDFSQVDFLDTNKDSIKILSTPDPSVAYGFPALPIDDKNKYTVVIRHKSSAASTNGLYLRLNQYNAALPVGKTHIGLADGGANCQAETGHTDLESNVAMPGTSWTVDTYTYTPTAGTKYASFSMYNWNPATAGVEYHVDYVLMYVSYKEADVITSQGDLATQDVVTADQVNTSTLSAITANCGTVNAGILQNAGATLKLDLTSGKLTVNLANGMEITSAGGVKVTSGGDITFLSTSTDIAAASFQGPATQNSRVSFIGANNDSETFLILPHLNETVPLRLGNFAQAWKEIKLIGKDYCTISPSTTDGGTFYIGESTYEWENGYICWRPASTTDSQYLVFNKTAGDAHLIYPAIDSDMYLGAADKRFLHVYADNLHGTVSDLSLADKICVVCGEAFVKDDIIKFIVANVNEKDIDVVPVHDHCTGKRQYKTPKEKHDTSVDMVVEPTNKSTPKAGK